MLLYVIPLLHSTLGSVKKPPSRHKKYTNKMWYVSHVFCIFWGGGAFVFSRICCISVFSGFGAL